MLRHIVITVLKNNCMSHILSLNNFLSKIELSVSLKALSSYQKSCLSQVLCSFETYDVHFWSSYIYYIYHTFNYLLKLLKIIIAAFNHIRVYYIYLCRVTLIAILTLAGRKRVVSNILEEMYFIYTYMYNIYMFV